MSGSARPKRPKAAGASLRYEHAPGRRTTVPGPHELRRRRNRDAALGCLFTLVAAAGIVGLALADWAWGHGIWGDLAPGWPGGGYGFALTVGVLLPLAAAAAIAPLTRMNWKRSKARSLARAAAALPGTAASALFLVVIGASWKPKPGHRDAGCHREGGPCWVHEQYPYVWAVGLAATLAVTALLITLLVRSIGKGTAPADSDKPTEGDT